jgi:hypothetical protein
MEGGRCGWFHGALSVCVFLTANLPLLIGSRSFSGFDLRFFQAAFVKATSLQSFMRRQRENRIGPIEDLLICCKGACRSFEKR